MDKQFGLVLINHFSYSTLRVDIYRYYRCNLFIFLKKQKNNQNRYKFVPVVSSWFKLELVLHQHSGKVDSSVRGLSALTKTLIQPRAKG